MLVSKNSKFTKKLVSLRVADNFKKIVIGKGATESNYNSKAVSEKGAEGVFQIMPADRKYLESEVKDQDYFKLDQFSKDLFLLISHYSDQYDYIYSKLSDEDKKRFDELANDRDLFENVLIPILVTGYNQGKGRSSRLFKLLVDMHDNNDIPDYAYDSKSREWKDLNSDAIIYMLPQALKIMKSENYKITKGYESTFKNIEKILKMAGF
jgi:hypothetical protein